MSIDFLERRIRIRPSWALYALLLLFIVYCISYSVHSNRMKNLNAEKTAREYSVAEAESQVEKLRREFAFRGTDEYIARVAREKFGYMMKGETRYMFEGVKAPEHIAPSIPVEFVPMETQQPEIAFSNPAREE